MLAQAAGPLPAALGEPAPVAVVAGTEAAVTAYPASFFADARPTSAFDMLARLPGFSFTGGEAVRGFAGAAGNVLIDGERPTSKAVTLEDLLRRLPASSVVRIDVIRGGAPGLDMQGQALVANVIRSRTASQDLAVAAGIRAYGSDGWLGPQADLEWARRAGGLSLEGGVHYGWTSSVNGGDGELVKYFPGGALKEDGPYMQRGRTGLLTANGSAELDRGDHLFRLNAGASRSDGRPYERFGRFAPSGAFRGHVVTVERTVTEKLEVGADYTRLIRPGLSAQVLALQTLGRVDSETTSTQPGVAQVSSNQESSGESIARATVSWQPAAAISIEAGGEGAFNFLEGHTTVSSNGAPLALPNADLRVEERRAEGFATVAWKPSERLSVEAGVRVEVSRISSSGDTARSRSFLYGKPRLVVAYAPDASSQLRLRLQRQVGQLRFRDFVASADLATGTLDAGNADLEPERSWIVEAALERRFWGRGAVTATFTHEAVQQAVDLIPIAGRDAPGNIGDGRRDRIVIALTLPLDRLGVRNGLITGQGTWKWSRVTDPVTGDARRISGEAATGGRITFTQDVARLSSTWGLEILVGESATSYRINEIRRQSEDGGLHAFWDWKPDRTLSVRGEFRNLASRERRRTRSRFVGNRALGVLNEAEWEAHAFEPYAYIRVRKVL